MTKLPTCCAVLLLSGMATMATVAATVDAPAETPPQQIGLVEQTDSELTQIDVTVIGPRELAASLTRDSKAMAVTRPVLRCWEDTWRVPNKIANARITRQVTRAIP